MNKLLYILLLSFFTLSAIGGKQERDKCGKEFTLKLKQGPKKLDRKGVDQNRRQRGSSSKDSAAFEAMVIKAKYEKELKRLLKVGKYKEGLELVNKLIKEGEGARFIARWKATFRIQLILKARPIYTRRFLSEPGSRNLSEVYFVLARALRIEGKYQESIENYDLAFKNLSLKSTIETISNLHHSRAQAISDLAYRTSDSSLAINLYKEAIADCERAIGVLSKNHPYLDATFALKKSITTRMNELARALHIKEKYQESIKTYDLAIENLSPESTIETISNLHHSRAQAISDLAYRTSDSSLAINLYKEAIADCERAIGILDESHPYLDAIFGLKKSITTRMNRLLGAY